MMPAPSIEQPETRLSPGQQTALLKLLADEDISVYQTVRGKILSFGPDVVSWVQPHTLSSDPILRRRAQEIVNFLSRQNADNAFLRFCLTKGEDLDVEEGAFLLAQTQYPEINIAAYQALLDNFAWDLKERVNFAAPAVSILAALNDYLFQEKHFHGNEEKYYEPDNSYLNRVIDRRTGNPISLCLIYMLVGRRLKLPLTGIGLPGHFLCRFQTPTEEVYIDVFNRGKLLARADCIKYLVHTTFGFQEEFLSPIMPKRTLLRMCTNLHQIYSQLSLAEEMSRFQRYIVALAK